MKYTQLGEFQELVLLVIGGMKEDVYGIKIRKAIQMQINRNPSMGALHSSLTRLETKGFLKSYEGGTSPERGGRRKKYYLLTSAGRNAIQKAYSMRKNLILQIPGLKP